MELSRLSNTELEQLARARKNPYYLTLRRPPVADIKGMREGVQELIKLWAREDNINSKDAADLLLLAELTGQEPDFVRLRRKHLQLQASQVLYGIVVPPSGPSK